MALPADMDIEEVSIMTINGSNDEPCVSEQLGYVEVRNHLCVRVINHEHNLSFLKDLPHVQMEDLSAVFLYIAESDVQVQQEETASPDAESTSVPAQIFMGHRKRQEHLIRWEDVRRWEITLEELFRDAQISSGYIRPVLFAPLRRILGLTEEPEEGEIPMYVLSCMDARYGASVLLYPDVIPRIADRLGDDIYIIPSSIHELIVLRAADMDDPQGLIAMIHEVNCTEVSPGDILSDSLYVYRRSVGELQRITGTSFS